MTWYIILLLADTRERLESNVRVMSEVLSKWAEDESDEGGETEGTLLSENW